MNLTAREAEIIRILGILSEKTSGLVVVGGYAVNALDGHRFSVDLDLVTDDEHLPHLDLVLTREKYGISKLGKPQAARHHVREYMRLVGKEPVKVALYVNSFVCRQTMGEWASDFISENSSKGIVVGATGSTQAPVVRRELLIAMKMHSCRDQDLRDIVMLSERVNWEIVAGLAARGSFKRVEEQIGSAIARVGDDRFESAIKAEFALRMNVNPLVKRTIRGLRKVEFFLTNQGVPLPLKRDGVRDRDKMRRAAKAIDLHRAEIGAVKGWSSTDEIRKWRELRRPRF